MFPRASLLALRENKIFKLIKNENLVANEFMRVKLPL